MEIISVPNWKIEKLVLLCLLPVAAEKCYITKQFKIYGCFIPQNVKEQRPQVEAKRYS
jgi:hypothetical protein